jgi:sugar transferase (PEP-CTERM/EpsH1 system associated)
MNPLAIAHVLSSFGTGGQERVALDLARRQHSEGHRVFAISLAPGVEGPLGAEFRNAGVETQTVPKGPGFEPSLAFRLSRLLTERRVNVVHTHNPHALIYGAPAASLARAAAVHTKHGMNPDTVRRMWLRRTASALVDAYVACTESLAETARKNSECDPTRLFVIPNGIDTSRFTPSDERRRAIRSELGIPGDAWVVGTVGRLAPEKDQALLIKAMGPLLDERRHLVIVGDGPEREALKAQVEATWRTQFVHMPGARNDVESLLAAFDAFALTSKTEGLPLGVLEAMSMGLPVIATKVGGIPDVIESGVTGYLVPAGGLRELTTRLVWLSGHQGAGREIGAEARRQVAAKYSVELMSRNYADLYERILSGQVRNRAPAEESAKADHPDNDEAVSFAGAASG